MITPCTCTAKTSFVIDSMIFLFKLLHFLIDFLYFGIAKRREKSAFGHSSLVDGLDMKRYRRRGGSQKLSTYRSDNRVVLKVLTT